MTGDDTAEALLAEVFRATPPELYCRHLLDGEDLLAFAARLDAAADITEWLLADLIGPARETVSAVPAGRGEV